MLILIIEDEAAIARFLKRGLNAHGHRVVCAYDGEEGTRLAVESRWTWSSWISRCPDSMVARC